MAGVTFWSVVFPLSARQYMSLHWYRKALTLIWLTSCLISIPYWIGNGHYSDFKNYRWSLNTANFAPKYGLATNIIVTVVILLVYPFCVWKLLKRRSISHHPENNLILTRSYITLITLFAISSVIFVLYWIPIYTCELFEKSVPYYGIWKETMRGILINYSIFVYCLIHKGIRLSVVSFIRGKNNCNRKSTAPPISSIRLPNFPLDHDIFPFNSWLFCCHYYLTVLSDCAGWQLFLSSLSTYLLYFELNIIIKLLYML